MVSLAIRDAIPGPIQRPILQASGLFYKRVIPCRIHASCGLFGLFFGRHAVEITHVRRPVLLNRSPVDDDEEVPSEAVLSK
jgi:hypothetical protein